MNAIITSSIVGITSIVVATAGLAAPAHAAAINGNWGADITVKGCDQLGSTASNNVGAIITIDGNNECDADTALKGVNLNGNWGSDITIKNVCGTPSKNITNNVGAIVNVESTGPCTATPTTTPPTVIITPPTTTPTSTTPTTTTTSTTTATPVVAASAKTASASMPAQLPETGVSLAPILASGLGVLTYAGAMAVRAFRARA